MKTYIKLGLVSVLSTLAVGSVACGTTAPPSELVDARAAYSRAAGGPAAQLNPADLHTAKEGLDAAERHPETAQMMIMNPLSGGGLAGLFSTHPPTEERVAALLAMARR